MQSRIWCQPVNFRSIRISRSIEALTWIVRRKPRQISEYPDSHRIGPMGTNRARGQGSSRTVVPEKERGKILFRHNYWLLQSHAKNIWYCLLYRLNTISVIAAPVLYTAATNVSHYNWYTSVVPNVHGQRQQLVYRGCYDCKIKTSSNITRAPAIVYEPF
jgi:hypothetical protein